jgi:adenylate cyclase
LFIEEVVQSLAEGGSLAGAKGAYRLVKPIRAISIPPTVQTVLAARIDRLPEREKRVLQTASVIGKTFSEPVLARVVDLSEAELAGALTSLAGAELVFEEALYPQAEYAFKHRLIQEVAYNSQLSDRRSRTHAAVARAIAELEAAKLDEQAALLAYHWEQAGDALEAASWHRRAAEWAGMNHPDEALRHWQSVRRLLGSVAETPAILAQRAIACAQAMWIVMRAGGSPEELEELSREGTDLAARTEDPHAVALVLHACGYIKAVRGQPDALDALRGAMRAADTTEDAGLKAAVRYGLSFGWFFAHKLTQGLGCADEGLALLREDARPGTAPLGFSPYLLLLATRGLFLTYLGRLEEAARDLDHALELAGDRSQASIVGLLHANRARIFQLAGDLERAPFHASQAVELAERSANKFQVLLAGAVLGDALVGNKRWSEALHPLTKVLELARAMQLATYQPWSLALLSAAHLGLGDVAAARAQAEEALRIGRQHQAKNYECMAAVVLARALLESEGTAARDSIERLLDDTLALSRESGAKTWEPFVHLERAELARRLGDEAARERELREAHRLFLEIGAPIRAAEVAKELGL